MTDKKVGSFESKKLVEYWGSLNLYFSIDKKINML